MPDRLTTTEAAQALGYSRRHVYRLCRRGVIKADQFNRTWMIPREEIDRIRALQDEHGNLPKGFLKP